MTGTRDSVDLLSPLNAEIMLISVGTIFRIAPKYLRFSDHCAQKAIYGFGTDKASSMGKDPRFCTPEVDHFMNIINECKRSDE